MAAKLESPKLNVKNESLLENTIESLQCFKCKAVPGFTQDQQNRYTCLDESHQLCEKCKSECECGSVVGRRPNPTTKKLLKDLPVYCPHYKNECRDIFLQADSLENHQQGCLFRKVFCPYLPCKVKIMFKDVIEHLKKVHGNKFWFVATENKYTFRLSTKNTKDGSNLEPHIFKIGSEVDFFLVGKIINKIAHFWLYIMASPLQAKHYAYTLSIAKENGNKFIKFHDYAKPLDEGRDEVLEKQSVFMIGTKIIKELSNEEKMFEIEVTIQDLKKKAKDDDEESGVEDESE